MCYLIGLKKKLFKGNLSKIIALILLHINKIKAL